MPFSLSVREEALVRSARRCCVCREFAGRAINVHHIHQEADGGSNALENAVVLCLRCHSEAGHFNPRHPIGTKYSPSELNRLRNQFWAAVTAGQVLPATGEIEIGWKRVAPSDGDRHTYQLQVSIHNGANIVSKWKLQLRFPSQIPLEPSGLTGQADETQDGLRYRMLEFEGATVFPREISLAIGTPPRTIKYLMTHQTYHADHHQSWQFGWKLFTDAGPAIEGRKPWIEMHQF